MKYLPIICLLLRLCVTQIQAQKPEPVYSIVKEDKPHEFYVKQAELWWKEIEKDKKNEKAWYYYYKANRYACMTFESCENCKTWLDESKFFKEEKDITDLISKSVPGTFTYYIVTKEGYPDDKERFNALQKAYELEPENPDTYDEFVVYFETNNLPEKRKEFNEKWFTSNDISSGILNYNYNVLAGLKPNSIILTFGDMDTFPVWMLQDVQGIRKDVTVLNVSLLAIQDYRNAIFQKLNIPEFIKEYPNGSTSEGQKEIIDYIIKNKPDNLTLYIGTPAWKQIEEYENNLYLIGLGCEYSTESIDNIALLKNNFENNYALDYLTSQFGYDISQGVVDRMNLNYLPGIIKLYQHYKLSGETKKAERMKEIGLTIANKSGGGWKIKATEIFE